LGGKSIEEATTGADNEWEKKGGRASDAPIFSKF